MIRVSMSVLLALFVLANAPDVHAQDSSWYPIKADDGSPVTNHRVPVELTTQLDALPGTVVVGNPKGDPTLFEFYDLNCPFCRAAAADLHEIIRQEKELKVVLVPFPVLGIPSIEASRVELAIAKLAPSKFYEFYRRVYAGRGVVDGNRALAVARNLGFDPAKLTQAANQDVITETMKAHVRLGDSLGLAATPSFVIMDAAILGYPGKASLLQIIRSADRCGRVVCQQR